MVNSRLHEMARLAFVLCKPGTFCLLNCDTETVRILKYFIPETLFNTNVYTAYPNDLHILPL